MSADNTNIQIHLYAKILRRNQGCLTTIVDLGKPKDRHEMNKVMNKAMTLARTSDADKRRVIATNYEDDVLPGVPDPFDQVQEEPILLSKVAKITLQPFS